MERFARDGAEPVPRSPQDTTAYIASEIEKWGKAVRMSGARAE